MINVEVLPNGTLRVKEATVSDGVMFDKISFSLPDNWKNYMPCAIFSSENTEPITIVLNNSVNKLCCGKNQCYIPQEVLVHPGFYVSVFGVNGNSRSTTTSAFVEVFESGYTKGSAPMNPTPDQYTQLFSMTQDAINTAQSVREDADKGVFKGEKGDTGAIGPKGEKGDTGEKGEKGDPGIIENIDIAFNPESENAQSGKAVAQAVAKGLGIVETELSQFFEIKE